MLAMLLVLRPVVSLGTGSAPVEGREVEGHHRRGDRGDMEEEDEDEERRPLLSFFDDKVSIGILLELVAEYADVGDESNRNSGERSDLYVSTIELELEIEPTDWLAFKAVGGIDDIARSGDPAKPTLSEAFARLRHPEFPVYVMGGLRPLPFGVFEDHLISGTLTEDLYEVVSQGATVGVAPGWRGLDLSLSVYEGQDVIENLEGFEAHEFSEDRRKEGGFDSYIVNLSTRPAGDAMSLSLFFDSEPGDGNQNQSLGAALTFRFWKLVADAEYITAIQRELGQDGEENLESAWFLALAHRVTESWELAARFELFNDDRPGRQDETVSYRYLAGFNYSVTDYATLSFEFRHTDFERERGSRAADARNELQLQLALRF